MSQVRRGQRLGPLLKTPWCNIVVSYTCGLASALDGPRQSERAGSSVSYSSAVKILGVLNRPHTLPRTRTARGQGHAVSNRYRSEITRRSSQGVYHASSASRAESWRFLDRVLRAGLSVGQKSYPGRCWRCLYVHGAHSGARCVDLRSVIERVYD